MTCNNTPSQPIYLGIDGGGSKCKARVSTPGTQGCGIAGPANPFQNLEQAKSSIIEATQLALESAGLSANQMGETIAGVGLAGVNVPPVMKLMQAWDHPFGEMHLTTDIHIACLAAHGGENGAVIVAGTGSVGYMSMDSTTRSYGGHGFPIGDIASGAWLGLEAIRDALLTLDSIGPSTALLPMLEQQLHVQGLGITDKMAGATSREYATLAPLVFEAAEQGDAVAEQIVRRGAAYLSAMAEKMLAEGATSFCMLGGLADKYQPWLNAAVINHAKPPQQEPDAGALLYARNCHLQTMG
ncbi:hypothetical protein A3709_08070 [Halioglobus sp. HI00S01]|uniref:BadF/BadG/BcrA/BcrD ATPase family protein n=1 Tax=Halioglobus sp. HI00S01 TaxID=1822214 RepID=UPI0007C3DFD3|nr:BadF/BadG/BcrA/BcrD ATPase family protein [Halioglobus sp. HI00S01]KZX54956.1 hypothetical protein A3709_08070 [Halioglobus sp. HI00S01]